LGEARRAIAVAIPDQWCTRSGLKVALCIGSLA
jgi:hypothetical protein